MILGATIRLRDQFTGTLNSVKKEVGSFRKEMKAAEDNISRTTVKLRVLGRTVARPVIKIKDEATTKLNSIKSALTSLNGMIAIGLTGLGIGKLGEATLGAAAQTELQAVGMAAVLKSQKKAKEYMDWTLKEATRTMFQDTEMMSAATSLAPYSRGDINYFKELMRTAEVLAAINPLEGLEGGAFALREALSGDFVSLQERFNLPRSVINNLKQGAVTAKDYLRVVQEAAKSLGYDYSVVEKQGKTAIGLWNKLTGNINAMFRSLGTGFLMEVKPRLEKISDWFDKNEKEMEFWKNKLVSIGRDAFGGILTWGESFLGDLKAVMSDPGFEKLDWSGKLGVLFDTTSDKVTPKIADMGMKMGQSLAEGLYSGLSKAIGQNPLLSLFFAGYIGSKVPGPFFVKAGVSLGILQSTLIEGNTKVDKQGHIIKEKGQKTFTTKDAYRMIGDHASGLPYVPYDNYLAVLHRGERVMTAAENRQYIKNGPNIAQPNITININGVNKSTREIIDEMVDELRAAMNNMPMLSDRLA